MTRKKQNKLSDAARDADLKKRKEALTAADLVVLSFLSEQPMHGYQLISEMQRQEIEDWAAISRPHVYYSLKKLTKLFLIEPISNEIDEKVREKTIYAVTKSGRRALEQALSKPTWAINRTPTSFTTWLGLSIHADPLAVKAILQMRYEFIDSQLKKEKITLQAMKDDSGERTKVGIAMVNLCIRQFEVELEWLDELMKQSRENKNDCSNRSQFHSLS